MSPFYISLILASIIMIAIYIWATTRPQRVGFIPTGSWHSRGNSLPRDFSRAWECLETSDATLVNAKPQSHCYICNRPLEGRYLKTFRFKGFIWSGLERQHMMYAHVDNGDDGVYLPERAFVQMVMDWYYNEYLPRVQAASTQERIPS